MGEEMPELPDLGGPPPVAAPKPIAAEKPAAPASPASPKAAPLVLKTKAAVPAQAKAPASPRAPTPKPSLRAGSASGPVLSAMLQALREEKPGTAPSKKAPENSEEEQE